MGDYQVELRKEEQRTNRLKRRGRQVQFATKGRTWQINTTTRLSYSIQKNKGREKRNIYKFISMVKGI